MTLTPEQIDEAVAQIRANPDLLMRGHVALALDDQRKAALRDGASRYAEALESEKECERLVARIAELEAKLDVIEISGHPRIAELERERIALGCERDEMLALLRRAAAMIGFSDISREIDALVARLTADEHRRRKGPANPPPKVTP